MSLAKWYRELAHECFSKASSAEAERDRDNFLRIAIGWMEAARSEEASARLALTSQDPNLAAISSRHDRRISDRTEHGKSRDDPQDDT
jgi:hypothetical protein